MQPKCFHYKKSAAFAFVLKMADSVDQVGITIWVCAFLSGLQVGGHWNILQQREQRLEM